MPNPRSDTISPTKIQLLHVFCRLVQRGFFMGTDSVSGINYDHRRDWLLDRIKLLAQVYCIDVITIAIMHNHFHLQVRTRWDLVQSLTDEEVLRRLFLLKYDRYFFPDGSDRKTATREIQRTLKDPKEMKKARKKLSNISKYMQSLNQHIAIKANRESNVSGTFFDRRFGHELLESERAILANALYIDSNPIRAEIASTPEESEFTGAYERIHDLRTLVAGGFGSESGASQDSELVDGIGAQPPSAGCRTTSSKSPGLSFGEIDPTSVHAWERSGTGNSGFMCPLEIDERKDPIGPDRDPGGLRPSCKGVLSMSLLDYLALLDFTGRQLRADKRGAIPSHLPPILKRIGIKFDNLLDSVRGMFAKHSTFFEAAERG